MLLAADIAIPSAQPILFVEFRFLWIFAIIFLVHWALRSNTSRKVWLLTASHVFYTCFFIGNPLEFFPNLFAGAWDRLPVGWWFPALLWGSTIMDYYVGIGIEEAKTDRRKKTWVVMSLLINLGVLCFFKYYGFFEENVRMVFRYLNLEPTWEPLKVFLPYGISFYTFQSLSYSIEVYRKHLPAERSFLNLAFFIAFFPQVVAGPIVRAMTFLPQTLTRKKLADVDVRACLVMFLMGFIKKSCIGDTLAQVSDAYFADPDRYDVFGTWMGVLCYAGQIYCDFSGYSDMAISVSRLLGYELCQNFNFPYFSRNIADFWRRWHMSLSSWLRDYLYISLGGNRGSKIFTYRNLMLTMLLGGLWHGASWNFAFWGALHGFALIAQREWQRIAEILPKVGRVVGYIAVPLTFYWVCLAWVPFRATPIYQNAAYADNEGQPIPLFYTAGGFQDAREHEMVFPAASLGRDNKTGNWVVKAQDGKPESVIEMRLSGFDVTKTTLRSMVFFQENGRKDLGGNFCLVLLAILALVHWINSRNLLSTWWRKIPDWLFSAILGSAVSLALYFKLVVYKQFIYFQF